MEFLLGFCFVGVLVVICVKDEIEILGLLVFVEKEVGVLCDKYLKNL